MKANEQSFNLDLKELSLINKNEVIKTGKRIAHFLTSGNESIHIIYKPSKKSLAHLLQPTCVIQKSRLKDKIDPLGFKIEFSTSALRFTNPYGFSLYFGKLLKWEKFNKIRFVKDGENSIYNTSQSLQLMKKVMFAIEDFIQETTNCSATGRFSRFDSFKDFSSFDLKSLISNSSPEETRKMKKTLFFMYENSNLKNKPSGCRWKNSTSEVNVYDKTLEKENKSQIYNDFYSSLSTPKNTRIFRIEVKQKSAPFLGPLFLKFRQSLNLSNKEMLSTFIDLTNDLFNDFYKTHVFKNRKNKVDHHIEKLFFDEEYELNRSLSIHSNVLNNHFNLSNKVNLNQFKSKDEIVSAIANLFSKFNCHPSSISDEDFKKIIFTFEEKQSRKRISAITHLNSQRDTLLSIIKCPHAQNQILQDYTNSRRLLFPNSDTIFEYFSTPIPDSGLYLPDF